MNVPMYKVGKVIEFVFSFIVSLALLTLTFGLFFGSFGPALLEIETKPSLLDEGTPPPTAKAPFNDDDIELDQNNAVCPVEFVWIIDSSLNLPDVDEVDYLNVILQFTNILGLNNATLPGQASEDAVVRYILFGDDATTISAPFFNFDDFEGNLTGNLSQAFLQGSGSGITAGLLEMERYLRDETPLRSQVVPIIIAHDEQDLNQASTCEANGWLLSNSSKLPNNRLEYCADLALANLLTNETFEPDQSNVLACENATNGLEPCFCDPSFRRDELIPTVVYLPTRGDSLGALIQGHYNHFGPLADNTFGVGNCEVFDTVRRFSISGGVPNNGAYLNLGAGGTQLFFDDLFGSLQCTQAPSKSPSASPTVSPTRFPTEQPTLSPSQSPSVSPTTADPTVSVCWSCLQGWRLISN